MDIQNNQALTRIFGKWPSFHDAEIISILLDRGGEDGPFMEAKIHLWLMTNEVDSEGYYVLKNHTLATLRFNGILLEALHGFNAQNVLFQLEISNIKPDEEESEGCRYKVFMPTSYGCEASFMCQSISVVAAEPYSE